MEIMVPGHSDSAMHLNAVLNELWAPVADICLRDSHSLACAFCAHADRAGGFGGYRLSRLKPHFHISESVFQGLIRRQGSAEGIAIKRVLHGEIEHAATSTDSLRTLQNERRSQLPLNGAFCQMSGVDDC